MPLPSLPMASPQIILLNGSSSSGKTTLAKMLQQTLPEPVQHVSLDQFRDGLPDRLRGLNSPVGTAGAAGLNVVPVQRDEQWLTAIRFGEHGERVLQGMRRSVRVFAELGLSVVVDDLLFKSSYLQDYAAVLTDFEVWFVGVRCDLDTVNEREASRAGRFPGTATEHFHSVHDHCVGYDIEVDTGRYSPVECAEQVIEQLGSKPVAFSQLTQRGS